jgi:hypothetical protein
MSRRLRRQREAIAGEWAALAGVAVVGSPASTGHEPIIA